MVSVRYITDQQFSDGTTIDGDRLEKAIQDIESYINSVPDSDFRNRWLQNQIVLKYLPYTADADTDLAASSTVAGNHVQSPYMSVYQSGEGITNAYRLKGNRLPWQEPFDTFAQRQFAWTTTFAIGDEPAILESIDINMASYGSEYSNTFFYDSSPPENQTPNSPVNDIHVSLTIDNPFIPSPQVLNSVLFHKYNFDIMNSRITSEAIAYSLSPDMNPPLAGLGGVSGSTSLFINESDLNIPIPPLSRLRFSLILPGDYGSGTGYVPWGLKPWQTFVPTMSLTLLERLQSD